MQILGCNCTLFARLATKEREIDTDKTGIKREREREREKRQVHTRREVKERRDRYRQDRK